MKIHPFPQEKPRGLTRPLEYYLLSSTQGMSVKSDGHKLDLYFDGQELFAFTGHTNGTVTLKPVPACCHQLARLNTPFLSVGEAIGGANNYHSYAIFNVLYWGDEWLLDSSGYARLRVLRDMAGALNAPLHPFYFIRPQERAGLRFVDQEMQPKAKKAAFEELAKTIPPVEGVIFRDLTKPHLAGSVAVKRYVFIKYVDVVAYQWFRGGSATRPGGSAAIGVYHRGQLVPVGTVGTGFTFEDIAATQTALEAGRHLVFKVSTHPSRTIGLTLVQAARQETRTDKLPEECTSEQFRELFGPERYAMFDEVVRNG